MASERDREDIVPDISGGGKSKVHERLLGTLNAFQGVSFGGGKCL
jgi:hypothetical protein